MNIAQNLKNIRTQHGYQQKHVALEIGIGITNYNRVENGQREASVEVLEKLSKFYNMTIDDIIHFNEGKQVPKEVVAEDKNLTEQVRLINELEPEEKNVIFKMVNTFLTQKKFKDFVQQNVAL